MLKEILACNQCGTVFNQDSIKEGNPCPCGKCSGVVEWINPILLPVVAELNRKCLCVKEATLNETDDGIEIIIIFKDDYGNSFPRKADGSFDVLKGFEFSPKPNPFLHTGDTPLKLTRTISCDLLPLIQRKELIKAVSDLLYWAEKSKTWLKWADNERAWLK